MNQWEVYKLLEKVPWKMRENRTRNLKCRGRGKENFDRRPLPSWLYQRLYYERNTFLHGNEIKKRQLLLPKTKRNIVDFAAPLYRMALTSFLDLRWKTELPPMEDVKAFAAACSERTIFDSYQREIEISIAMSRGYEPNHAAVRRKRRRRTT